jgi:hypothetical protein
VKYEKSGQFAINGAKMNRVERASFGGLHLWGYTIATVAELRVIREQRRTIETYYDVAKRDFDFWKANYRLKETDLRDEVFSVLPFIPNYKENSGLEAFDLPKVLKQERELLDNTPQWQTGFRFKVTLESSKRQMLTRAAGRMLAYRFNYAYAERENIKRIARRQAVVNMGIQAGNIANAGLAQMTSRAVSSLGQVQSSFRALRNDFSFAAGFNERRRLETQ